MQQPAPHPNFCPTCGGGLSPDGKTLQSVSVKCATCRRRVAKRDDPRHSTQSRLKILALCAVTALVAACVVAWVIAIPSARVFEPAAESWTPPQITPAAPIAPPAPILPAIPSTPAIPGTPAPFDTPPAGPAPSSAPPRIAHSAPRGPVVPEIVHDPKRDQWEGAFLLQTRANVASIFINGQSIFSTNQAGVYLTPAVSLHRNDLVVFEVIAPSGVMRAAFVTTDGKLQIPLHAADLRDLGDRTNATPTELAAYHDSPAAVSKVNLAEVTEWESAAARHVPHGSEYVNGKSTNTYHLGFVVSSQAFRPLRTTQLTERRLYLFDNVARTETDWKWKANLTMNADGATGPQEPDNELVSRFLLDGDFTVDLDADFGQAVYTNTGGMLVAVCKQEIGFDGGWNFGSWGPASVHIRVQRQGDELQLIRDGQVLIVPVPDAERREPTPWRLWWRSRSSHFHSIKVSGERIVDTEGRF